MDTVIVVALVSAVPGLVALILQFRKNKVEERVSEATITEKITAAANDMLNKLQSQVRRLEEEIAELKIRIELADAEVLRLTKGINKLIVQTRKRGEEPCWTPDED